VTGLGSPTRFLDPCPGPRSSGTLVTPTLPTSTTTTKLAGHAQNTPCSNTLRPAPTHANRLTAKSHQKLQTPNNRHHHGNHNPPPMGPPMPRTEHEHLPGQTHHQVTSLRTQIAPQPQHTQNHHPWRAIPQQGDDYIPRSAPNIPNASRGLAPAGTA
jgi:hypothetical protein